MLRNKAEHLVQHRVPDGDDKALGLRRGDKDGGGDQPVLRVDDARQRLRGMEAAGADVIDGLVIHLQRVFLDRPVKDLLNVRLDDEEVGKNDLAGAEGDLVALVDLLELVSEADDVLQLLQVVRDADQADPRFKADSHLRIALDDAAGLGQQALADVLRVGLLLVHDEVDGAGALEIELDAVLVLPVEAADLVGDLREVGVVLVVAQIAADLAAVQHPDDDDLHALAAAQDVADVCLIRVPALHADLAVHALLRAHDREHDAHGAERREEHLEQQLRAEELDPNREIGQRIHQKQRGPLVLREKATAIDAAAETGKAVEKADRIEHHHQRAAGVADLRRNGEGKMREGIDRQQDQNDRIGQAKEDPAPFFPNDGRRAGEGQDEQQQNGVRGVAQDQIDIGKQPAEEIARLRQRHVVVGVLHAEVRHGAEQGQEDHCEEQPVRVAPGHPARVADDQDHQEQRYGA